MKDTLSMIVAVIFLVILLVLLPLYNYFERQDDMSYNLTLKTVTMFVDEVAQNGYIDQLETHMIFKLRLKRKY